MSVVTDRWREAGRGEAKRLELHCLRVCVCLEEIAVVVVVVVVWLSSV